MTQIRKPAAFKIEAKQRIEDKPFQKNIHASDRKPRSVSSIELIEETHTFDQQIELIAPDRVVPEARKLTPWKVFLGATGFLLSLASGVWVDGLIRNLFSRADWLGYIATATLVIALVALLFIVVREIKGLAYLNAASVLREQAHEASSINNLAKARVVLAKLEVLFADAPQTARARALLKETQNEIIDGVDLMRLAEQALLKPIDEAAKKIILDSAKRVSVVTAVSPRALVDLAYVIYESAKMIRQLAQLYGGRPGTLGLIRLSKNTIAHLAVTGSIAIGDGLIQQLVGHGVAAKISSRLGEGVINGLMTTRLGISAMDIVRPMEFTAEKRPNIRDFLSDLTSLTTSKNDSERGK